MNAKQLLILGASLLASSVSGLAFAEEMQGQYVQVAEIEIVGNLQSCGQGADRNCYSR